MERARVHTRRPLRAVAKRARRPAAVAAGAVLALTLIGTVAWGGELQDLHTELVVFRAAEQDAATRGATGDATNAGEPLRAAPAGSAFLPGFGPSARPSERPGEGIERIGLERTRCLVGCPAFTLIVERDGSFRWVGEFGVERMGEHSGRIEPGRVLQVMDVVADLEIAALDATYASPFLDNPTSYVMVENEAGTHVIENQAGTAPPRVWAVEQLIEGLLAYAEWDPPVDTTE